MADVTEKTTTTTTTATGTTPKTRKAPGLSFRLQALRREYQHQLRILGC